MPIDTGDDADFEEEYVTEDWGCPPHLLALCGFCGYDVCSDCNKHLIDGEEQEECQGLTASSSSPGTAS